jgi:serine/threonine protein kinase
MQPSNSSYHQQFRLVHSDWYESFDFYQPHHDLLQIVRSVIPATWRLSRSHVWFTYTPPEGQLPRQGWKIHISATPLNCGDILRAVAIVCHEKSASFKFLLDSYLVDCATSKGWPREASGKVITIYPLNDEHFHELLEALYRTLKEFNGPYIMSDRRFRDASTIYYRYGGIAEFSVLTIHGDRQHRLVSPSGDLVPDERVPFWNPPSWVNDPFKLLEDEDAEPILNNGRYLIQNVLNFSVTGGVYLAVDRVNGSSVVIKEARPNAGVDRNGVDAIARLKKEFRLLHRLQDTGITPQPLDLFWDWEHLFLVEEQITGLDLGRFTISRTPLLQIKPNDDAKAEYVKRLRCIWTNLASSIAAIHECGIVCGDLSIKNVIVQDEYQGDIRIIDLEGAWEEGIDVPTRIITPGYTTSKSQEQRGQHDDYYALGSIMLGSLLPINNILEINPTAKDSFVETMCTELGVPTSIQRIILQSMDDQASARPRPHQVAEIIQQTPTQSSSSLVYEKILRDDLQSTVRLATDYIRNNANFTRRDRLFPADPLVFYTNPLSVAYGAAGIIYALAKIDGNVPDAMISWMLSHPIHPDYYPPGLYIGSAGIAWVLWEVGLHDVAIQTLREAGKHGLLWEAADVFYGAAGYGLACLRFYLNTKDDEWLDQAIHIGDRLLATKVDAVNGGCYWRDKDGKVWLGYTRGASGIALFLLYLSLATGKPQYIEVGHRALGFDLAYSRETEAGHLSIPRGTIDSFENVLTHYWLDGSAGVASVLVRYLASTKVTEYRDFYDRLAPDTFRKFVAFPNLFRGLAGLGNFLLDAYAFTGDASFLDEAYHVASGVMLFRINRHGDIAFPGEQLYRISNDFGTGGAGIVLFLNRLAHEDQQLGDFNFTLDQLITSRPNATAV